MKRHQVPEASHRFKLLSVVSSVISLLSSCLVLSTLAPSQGLASDDYDPVEITKGIHGNWPRQIRALPLSQEKSYILLLLSPPKAPMDLSTAERFRETLSGFLFFSGPDIGHAMVGWQCHTGEGQLVRGFTGMSGEDSGQSGEMVKRGWGATTFLSTFTDGYLQDSSDIQDTIEEGVNKDRKQFEVMAIEVADSDCMKTESFLSEFLNHERRPALRFGLVPKPARFEGGGCGSFAVTMSDQTGVWPGVSSLFWRTLRVPKSLMGWKAHVPVDTEVSWPWPEDFKHKRAQEIDVPLDQFRLTPWIVRPGEPSVPLTLVDPELMLLTSRTIKEIANREVSASGRRHVDPTRLAPVSKRVVRLAVPFKSFDGDRTTTQAYYKWVEINAAHDPQATRLVQAVRTWWKERAQQGNTIRPVNQGGLAGVVIEKAR